VFESFYAFADANIRTKIIEICNIYRICSAPVTLTAINTVFDHWALSQFRLRLNKKLIYLL